MALPEKATRPARSDCIIFNRSMISLLARSSRVGLMSVASMLREQSRAIMISTPFCSTFSQRNPNKGPVSARIARKMAATRSQPLVQRRREPAPGAMSGTRDRDMNWERMRVRFRIP